VTRSTFAEEYGPIIEMAETRDASQILERIWSRPGKPLNEKPSHQRRTYRRFVVFNQKLWRLDGCAAGIGGGYHAL
jgi:hypothetical protein